MSAMAKFLMNLHQVPDDEADDVRALLDEHRIAYYETKPSRWGISHGGLWLSDESDEPRARRVLDAYQAERRERARADYASALREGRAETFWTLLREQPVQVTTKIVAIVLLLALVFLPVYLLR